MFRFKKGNTTLDDIISDVINVKQKLLDHYSSKRESFHEVREKKQSLIEEEHEIEKEIERTRNIISKIDNFLGEND